MRFEHKLNPIIASFAQETIKAMQDVRNRYFAALGQAREAQEEHASLQRTLQTQLEIVRQQDKLPASQEPYRLNADATALITDGVVIEDAPVTYDGGHPDILPPRMVNGSGAIHEDGGHAG